MESKLLSPGGILRDANGHLLVAYSTFLGQGTSLRAETLAILIGLRLCYQKRYSWVRLQSDSLVSMEILQRRSSALGTFAGKYIKFGNY